MADATTWNDEEKAEDLLAFAASSDEALYLEGQDLVRGCNRKAAHDFWVRAASKYNRELRKSHQPLNFAGAVRILAGKMASGAMNDAW